MRVILNLSGGFETRKSMTLEKPGDYSIGRVDGCDCPVYDPRISKKHCAIILTSEGASVRDLGSTNGTLVDGVVLGGEEAPPDGTHETVSVDPVSAARRGRGAGPIPMEAPLKDGSRIEMGSTRIIVSILADDSDRDRLAGWLDDGNRKVQEAIELFRLALQVDPQNGRIIERIMTLETGLTRWGAKSDKG